MTAWPTSRARSPSPAAKVAAVLDDGAVEASSNGGGTWGTLARPGAIAASAAGQRCGTVHVTSVSFGPVRRQQVLAAADVRGDRASPTSSPIRPGTDGSGSACRLRAAGAAQRGEGAGAGQAGLTELWGGATRFTGMPTPRCLSSATPTPRPGIVRRTGRRPRRCRSPTRSPSPAAWRGRPRRRRAGRGCCCRAGQEATIGGPGQQWLLLPPTPAHTTVLASGPGTALDALGRFRVHTDRVAARPRVDRVGEGADHPRADSSSARPASPPTG